MNDHRTPRVRNTRVRLPWRLGLLGAPILLALVWVGSPSPAPGWDINARFDWVEVEHYESLAEMTNAADAVVLGRVTAVNPGRTMGTDDTIRYAAVTVEVDELLSGTLVEPSNGAVNLEIYPGDKGSDAAIARLSAGLPRSNTVLFLRNKGMEAAALGWPEQARLAELPFHRLMISSAVIVNDGGRTTVPAMNEDAQFLAQLHELGFVEAVESIRSLAAARP